MDVRPGGIFSIDIAMPDGREFPNLGCFLEVIPMERLVWTSMLFPGYRPAVFDDIPITAIVTMEAVGTGTRYVFTALLACSRMVRRAIEYATPAPTSAPSRLPMMSSGSKVRAPRNGRQISNAT